MAGDNRRLSLAACTALVITMAAVPAVRAGAGVSCTFSSQTGILKVNMGPTTVATLKRDAAGTISVVNRSCTGPTPTVTNTKQIKVAGGDGTQSLSIDLGNGGFAPGSVKEIGTSAEIEFSALLGGGTFDSVIILGSSGADAIRLGIRGSGGSINVPAPRINLNANESSGIDDDVIMLGVEKIVVAGNGGPDTVSGEGGAGTGEPIPVPLDLKGDGGADVLTGGTGGDILRGGSGGDTLKGGQGADDLIAEDGISANDSSSGGKGSDTCDSDAGDAETSCEN